MLNAESMLLVEKAVEWHIQDTGNHVLYRVTPFYHGDDLVPFGVQIEAESMETDVDGIACNLFLYNIQPGVEIDYATGESWVVDSPEQKESDRTEVVRTIPAANEEKAEEAAEEIEVTYVLNKNTGKFHKPDCQSVADMKAKNRQDVDWSREEVVAAGYEPCGRCKP